MINLKDQKKWRVIIDNGEYVIKGKFGQVSVYGDNELDIWVCTWEPALSDQWPQMAKRSERRSNRMEREGWKAKQHYDDGGLFIRPFSDLDKACIYIKAGRKRQVTEAMREAGRKYAVNLHPKKKDMGLNASNPDELSPAVANPITGVQNE